MENRERKIKTPSVKNVLYKMFLEMPIPMTISRADDGTYVDVNETSAKYMGLKRKDIIGRKSSDFGHLKKGQRQLLINEIKKHGFARNLSVELNIKNKGVLHMLCSIFPFKIGKETYLWGTATNVSNSHKDIEKFRDEKFIKIIIDDYKFVEAKLKQYKLTSRQGEIALLSSIGHSNREIAKKLYLSEYTVKDHIKEIFRVIGIKNRSELFPKLLNLR